MNALANRPRDPSLISFAPECFAQVGTRVQFVVTLPAPRYPAVFDDEATAGAFARARGRGVRRRETPILARVRWVP